MTAPGDRPAEEAAGPLRRLEALEREVARLRAELLPQRAEEELPEALDALLATVAGALVAIPLADVVEVIPRVPIVPLPEAPPHLLGHMRWRGDHVPVIDPSFLWLARRLEPPRLDDRIVVARDGGATRGLLVRDVPGVDRFRRGEWSPVRPDAGGARYALALAHRPDGEVLLLSLARLFEAAPVDGATATVTAGRPEGGG